MNIDAIQNGIVIDHIEAGKGMEIYRLLGLGDLDVLVLYGLTFLAAGIVSWLYLLLRTKKAYNPFVGREVRTKGVAACFEEFGQVFYVFAMSRNPVVAAPMVASYCIVSVILSRIFLKEKLTKKKVGGIALILIGIVVFHMA